MMKCSRIHLADPHRSPRRGFTFLELLVVIMLLGMMALFAIPMMGNSSTTAVHAAAIMLRSDLERAQVMAVAHPDQRIALRFDEDGGGWQLVDADTPSIPLSDEYSGQPISVRLGTARGQAAEGVEFDPTGLSGNLLVFNALGGLEFPGPPTQIHLRRDDRSAAVQISSATGWITID